MPTTSVLLSSTTTATATTPITTTTTSTMTTATTTTITTTTTTKTTTKRPKCPSLSGILTNQLRIWYRTQNRGFGRQKMTIWPQKWLFLVPSFVESVFGIKCPFFESWYPFFILWIVFLTYFTDFQKKRTSCFQKMGFRP